MLNRPLIVAGATYKIKPPIIEEAVYITINSIVNEDESLRPIEIFINSKNMESFQWISCITQLISGAFRQDGEFPKYIIDELITTTDPKSGGYIAKVLPKDKKSQRIPSIVAHIGLVLERHCHKIGILK